MALFMDYLWNNRTKLRFSAMFTSSSALSGPGLGSDPMDNFFFICWYGVVRIFGKFYQSNT